MINYRYFFDRMYCNQLDNMKSLAEKEPRLVNRDRPIPLHDNACPLTANWTQLNMLEFETIDHPTYSPDLSPTDRHLFRNLDNFLQDKIFNSQQAVENASRALVGSRSSDFYAKGA